MLVRFEDIKGGEVWINPVHVKLVKQARRSTEIVMALSSSFGNSVIKVRLTPEEVSLMLNAGMPEILPLAPEDDHDTDGGAAAAVIAAG